MRNAALYPRIVRLDSAGHYPERYVQVTQAEFDDLATNRWQYHGSMGTCDNLKYLYGGPRYIGGQGLEDRTISEDEVDQLPKDIPSYCEYE